MPPQDHRIRQDARRKHLWGPPPAAPPPGDDEDATPIARTAYRDSFPVLDTSDLPPQPRSGLLRDRVTNMREACLRNGVSMLGVIG